jgi:hypothetical protein
MKKAAFHFTTASSQQPAACSQQSTASVHASYLLPSPERCCSVSAMLSISASNPATVPSSLAFTSAGVFSWYLPAS